MATWYTTHVDAASTAAGAALTEEAARRPGVNQRGTSRDADLSEHSSRRRRGRDVDILWRRVPALQTGERLRYSSSGSSCEPATRPRSASTPSRAPSPRRPGTRTCRRSSPRTASTARRSYPQSRRAERSGGPAEKRGGGRKGGQARAGRAAPRLVRGVSSRARPADPRISRNGGGGRYEGRLQRRTRLRGAGRGGAAGATWIVRRARAPRGSSEGARVAATTRIIARGPDRAGGPTDAVVPRTPRRARPQGHGREPHAVPAADVPALRGPRAASGRVGNQTSSSCACFAWRSRRPPRVRDADIPRGPRNFSRTARAGNASRRAAASSPWTTCSSRTTARATASCGTCRRAAAARRVENAGGVFVAAPPSGAGSRPRRRVPRG